MRNGSSGMSPVYRQRSLLEPHPMAWGPGVESLRRHKAQGCALAPAGVPPSLQSDQILKNGAVGFVTMTSSFGIMVGLVQNLARAQTKLLPRLATAPCAVVAGAASAGIEAGVESLTGFRATPLPVSPYRLSGHALVYNSLLPAYFLAFNFGYSFSNLPKYPAAGMRGGLMALTVTGLGASLGRGCMEAYAQDLHASAPELAEDYGRPTVGAVAAGRALSQVPAALWTVGEAFKYRGELVPRQVARALPVVIALTYPLRGVLSDMVAQRADLAALEDLERHTS